MPTSAILMPSRTHEGDSTVETVVGDRVPGAGYYGRTNAVHSVQYSVDGFTGTIKIQAAVALQPEDRDWFTVEKFEIDAQESDDDSTYNNIATFEGNYVWIRCMLEYSEGHVQSVLMRF